MATDLITVDRVYPFWEVSARFKSIEPIHLGSQIEIDESGEFYTVQKAALVCKTESSYVYDLTACKNSNPNVRWNDALQKFEPYDFFGRSG